MIIALTIVDGKPFSTDLVSPEVLIEMQRNARETTAGNVDVICLTPAMLDESGELIA